MSKYGRKVAEENANFLDSYLDAMGMMAEMVPEELRDDFKAALDDVRPAVEHGQEVLRSGAVDDALEARKPPALWELEKKMFNQAAKEVGGKPIEEYEGGEGS